MFGMSVKRPADAGEGRVPEQPNRLPMLSGMAKAAETPPAETPVARGRRLAWSTAIFALATGISRVLGLIREVVAAYYFGASGKINAFTIAFQVPNLFRALVADAALSSAFVPVFSELLEKGDRRRAWRGAARGFLFVVLRPRAPPPPFLLPLSGKP